MTYNRNDFKQWHDLTEDVIFATSIAVQAHAHVEAGKGEVTAADMARFADEAEGVRAVWRAHVHARTYEYRHSLGPT